MTTDNEDCSIHHHLDFIVLNAQRAQLDPFEGPMYYATIMWSNLLRFEKKREPWP